MTVKIEWKPYPRYQPRCPDPVDRLRRLVREAGRVQRVDAVSLFASSLVGLDAVKILTETGEVYLEGDVLVWAMHVPVAG